MFNSSNPFVAVANSKLKWFQFIYQITCHVGDSLKVNSIDSCDTIQRAVFKRVRGKSVVRCIPQTAAADLHALSSELANVYKDNYLISGDHEVLHTGSYYLEGQIETIRSKSRNSKAFIDIFISIYLAYCLRHFLRPLYFVFLLLEITGEYIFQYVLDSRDREAFAGSCGPNNKNKIIKE